MQAGVRVEATLLGLALLALLLGYGLGPEDAAGFEPGTRPDDVLRGVTWNVGGGSGAGGTLRDEHIDHVATILEQLDPDICFLQEIRDRQQYRALRDRLGEAWQGRLARERNGRRVAILVQEGTLQRLRPEGVPAHTMTVSLESRRHGRLVAMCLHASTFSAEERNEEIGGAYEALRRYRDRHPILMAGDLNLDLDLDKRRDLFSDNEYLDVETYNYVASEMLDTSRGTGATAEPDRRLDYIFVDPVAFELRSAGPWRNRRVGDMDHDPVIADLRLVR